MSLVLEKNKRDNKTNVTEDVLGYIEPVSCVPEDGVTVR